MNLTSVQESGSENAAFSKMFLHSHMVEPYTVSKEIFILNGTWSTSPCQARLRSTDLVEFPLLSPDAFSFSLR